MPVLRLSAEAKRDLRGIWRYIARESGSTERADSFADRFSVLFASLAQSPYIGRGRDDLRLGCRSFPLSDYVVLYRVTPDAKVVVLRVVHGKRDLPTLLSGAMAP